MEYNELKLDASKSLSLTAFIGFADKPDFVRIPNIPITEDTPLVKWSFTVSANFTLNSGTYPDESLLPPDTDIVIDDPIIIGPLPEILANVDLKVDILRSVAGLTFTINRSGRNIPDWENVFVTLIATRTDKSQGSVVFQDVLGRPEEPPRISIIPISAWQDPAPADPVEEPNSIPFQDFTSSIAESIKKAQTQIQEKLGSESFDLDLEHFEIKTPYIVNIGSNNELLMTKPASGEQSGSYEPAFSRMTFRKTFKFE